MGNNVRDIFIIEQHSPSDAPVSGKEYAIKVIKEQNSSRAIAIAYEYTNLSNVPVYYRALYNGAWRSNAWIKI